jgi:hypothetical protein
MPTLEGIVPENFTTNWKIPESKIEKDVYKVPL